MELKPLSVGDHPRPMKERGKDKLWHRDSTRGYWWTGFYPNRESAITTEELLAMCRSIEADLMRAFPDLK
jgi:hypothetical protein